MPSVRGCVWGAARVLEEEEGLVERDQVLLDLLERIYEAHSELHGAKVTDRHVRLAALWHTDRPLQLGLFRDESRR